VSLLERLVQVDYAAIERVIADRLKKFLETAGANCYVLGLSGGVDSSTVAALAARAVGPERVVALIMPDSTSTPKEDLEDAEKLAKALGVKSAISPIDDLLSAAARSLPFFDPNDRAALGNVKARLRMVMLYYAANRLGGLVLGSGDRSEILLGYFTKYGDGAADLLPIGDLYKTQVRRLARHLGLPESIAFKPSSPRLWPGQMAESELGFTYEVADQVLYAVFDLGYSVEEAARAANVPLPLARRIVERAKLTEHKRRPPPVIELRGLAHP
jgi:NAD+ synthase